MASGHGNKHMDVKIDLERVGKALFEDPKQRGRIARDYGVSDQFSTAGEFVDRLVKALDQAPVANPLRRGNLSPPRVFRAAVMALGSNSRKWAAFLKQEEALSRKLRGYDPEKLSLGDIHVEELLSYFPGLTCTKVPQTSWRIASRPPKGARSRMRPAG